MIDAVKTALDDPQNLSAWSKNARAHVVEKFQLSQEAEALIAIYRDLLKTA